VRLTPLALMCCVEQDHPPRVWWGAGSLCGSRGSFKQAGHSVRFQTWDFGPGSNFVLAMHEAAQRARRTIVVLLPAFLASRYAAAE
jgi:hypothetical protein